MQQYHSATLMIFSGVVNDDLDFNYGSGEDEKIDGILDLLNIVA